MIGYLKGKLLEYNEDHLIVNVQGVGYEVICSQTTLNESLKNEDVSLWIYTHVREDVIQLFGFSTQLEKKLFLSLNKVNGIGPKLAITILSGAPLGQLIELIESSDVKGLTKIPKVGKKTAEQLILTLKGNLVMGDSASAPEMGHKKEIISALVNLGFRFNDAEEVVKNLPNETSVEEGVRKSLSLLSRGL